MKKLLSPCSFLAGCLCYFSAQIQAQTLAQMQTPTQAQTPAQAQTLAPVQLHVQSGRLARSLSGSVAADSLPLSGITKVPPGVKIITGGDQVYNGHLLVKKVPYSYNGHLLVKSPDDRNRHLRVVPPPGTPESRKADLRKVMPGPHTITPFTTISGD